MSTECLTYEISEVFELAKEHDMAIFCGDKAFEHCSHVFKRNYDFGEFYIYISVDNIKIIKCHEMESNNIFACDFINFLGNIGHSTNPIVIH